MNTNNISAADQSEFLKKHVRQLAEHFETVQVFASVHLGDKDGTRTFAYGSGNLYARTGQVHEWITKHDEQSREEVRNESDE